VKSQRGYIQLPSGGELLGCLVIVLLAASLIGGGFFYWLLPKLWAWLKPIIHGLTA
jgi:hypothetical protein